MSGDNPDIIKKVSAGGVLFHKGKFLVIKWGSQQTIELPKGTIEAGETPEQTCIREMLEETGYNVNIIDFIDSTTFEFDWKDGNRYEKTVHYFLTKRADNLAPTPMREDNEDFENEWLTYDQALAQLTHDDSKYMVEKAWTMITA